MSGDASEIATGLALLIDVGGDGLRQKGPAFAAGVLGGGALAVAAGQLAKHTVKRETPPAIVPDPPPAPQQIASARTIVVRDGDTPWLIAGRIGARVRPYWWIELRKANPQKATTPNEKGWKSLIPGDTIIVPPEWPPSAATQAEPDPQRDYQRINGVSEIATGLAALMTGPVGPPGLVPILGPNGGPGYVTPEEAERRGATYEIMPDGRRAWNLTTVYDYSVGASSYPAGQPVMAQWDDGKWYGAKIVSYDAGSTKYRVAWDDGSAPSDLYSSKIRPHDLPSVGDHVDAQWTDGGWYGAKVLQLDSGMGIQVAWDDGADPSWLRRDQIRPFSSAKPAPAPAPAPPESKPAAKVAPPAARPTTAPQPKPAPIPSATTAHSAIPGASQASAGRGWVLPAAAAAFVGAGVAFWQSFKGGKKK